MAAETIEEFRDLVTSRHAYQAAQFGTDSLRARAAQTVLEALDQGASPEVALMAAEDFFDRTLEERKKAKGLTPQP